MERPSGYRVGLNRFDYLLVISLVLLIAVYSSLYINFAAIPFEDAAILMRYSQHLAQGHGIVWNVGGKPVEGATDFLPMVLFAALKSAGMSLENAVRFVTISAHVLSVVFVYLAIRDLYGSSRWVAWISAGFLAIGPGLTFSQMYFATPIFALFCCVAWYLANKLLAEPNSHTKALMFALASLTLGLTRPEGVFLAVFFLLGILCVKGLRQTRLVWVYFCATFAFLGGLYFLWRWAYFGYPLPNPFYKKGGGHIYLDSLKVSIKNAVELTFPFALAFIYPIVLLVLLLVRRLLQLINPGPSAPDGDLGYDGVTVAKRTIFPLIPIVGFTTIWLLLSDEMNFYGRFQYVVLPIILMSWPSLLVDYREYQGSPRMNDLDRRLRAVLTFLIVLGLIPTLAFHLHRHTEINHFDEAGSYDVAVMLSSYDHGYTMAVSEAGLLPLYSGWKAIDTWGLNDQWIAHHGEITESYLGRFKPEVIMVHEDPNSPLEGWNSMVAVVKDYAEKNNYILAAEYGNDPHDVHLYYVRLGFPDSIEIAERICQIDYVFPYVLAQDQTVNHATNYAPRKPHSSHLGRCSGLALGR
jgi:arabinofuranosyltransferase